MGLLQFFGRRLAHFLAQPRANQMRPSTSDPAMLLSTLRRGDVLLVESEQDDYVPHSTLMSYRSAFVSAHSLTHRIVDGADHALSSEASQKAYSSILAAWISEMVIGARLDRYPHYAPWYA